MKKVKTLDVFKFDSPDELAVFLRDGGHAEFYDSFEGEYIPLRMDAEGDYPVLGSDAWETVEARHLPDIYGLVEGK